MPPPASRGRLSARNTVIVATAFGLWLLIAAVVVAIVWRERQRELDRASAAATATTALMEAHTANTFQVVDLALQEVARRLEEEPVPRNDVELRDLMRERLKDMPYVRAMFVVGPDGFIQHDTDYPSTPAISLADRGYFVAHRNDPARVHDISAPLQSRSGTGWFVAATRRVGTGEPFRGIVVAAIQLRYFSDLYERMHLGPAHRIVLFHRDGRLIAQHPPEGGVVGASYAEYPLFRTWLPRQASGIYFTEGPPVGFERLFSYEAVHAAPLVVALSSDVDAVLAPWRRSAKAAAAGLATLLLTLALAVGMFLRGERHRARSRERLAQGEKMEALGQLTGTIAHDFGNVLGIVGTNLALLQHHAGDDPQAHAALERAQRAVQTGGALTTRLLSFARRRELQVREAELGDLLPQVLPLLQQAAGTGVEVALELAPDLPRVAVDTAQLEVALINLVANARDALQGRGRVVVRGSRGAEHRVVQSVCLTVRDDGPGMPEEVRRRAVEPFFTTKGEAGTGLGLAQVYGFVQQLGGDVSIESAPGQGTAVHLFLPIAQAGR